MDEASVKTNCNRINQISNAYACYIPSSRVLVIPLDAIKWVVDHERCHADRHRRSGWKPWGEYKDNCHKIWK